MYLLGKHIRVTGDERKCVGIVWVIFNHFCLFPVGGAGWGLHFIIRCLYLIYSFQRAGYF